MELWIVRRALFLQTLRARLKLIMRAISKGILYFARTQNSTHSDVLGVINAKIIGSHKNVR